MQVLAVAVIAIIYDVYRSIVTKYWTGDGHHCSSPFYAGEIFQLKPFSVFIQVFTRVCMYVQLYISLLLLSFEAIDFFSPFIVKSFSMQIHENTPFDAHLGESVSIRQFF